ncbi:tol-pal system YbgF family protein [Streptomyces sp. NPDC102274]|uniref:tetratricopeptide repeat protein n=1 Tax=Streptomyces sp. NPDC102274 TaxID=3366151 RepID=UPI00382084FA
MDDSTHAVPEPAPPGVRAHDPLAVALGNASLLGVGYLILGRRKLAIAAVVVTVVLVSVVVSVARSWCEVVVLLWWAAVVVHGWFLARGRAERVPARRPRLIALGVTVPVLLAVGLLRYDAFRIDRGVDEARERGDCAQVLTAQGRAWFGHRMADAPLAARGDEIVEACHRLRTAKAELTTGLTGDTKALKGGFDTLASVLAESGRNEKSVEVVLDGFLGNLPTKDPCRTVTVTDWLRDRKPIHNALDQSADIVTRTAPAALVGCGDDLMAGKDWEKARQHYNQLLTQYPDDERTKKARSGVRKATLTIELANVRELLDGSTGSPPEYCSAPAKYSGAAPYRKGTNRALFYGNDEYTDKLPATWRVTDPAKAVLVVCADEEQEGTPVRTCPYESKLALGGTTDVTFHKIEIPVKAYELRTGKLVADRTVRISGSSCPAVLEYTTYISDFGPPSDVNVEASKADVGDGFRSLITR